MGKSGSRSLPKGQEPWQTFQVTVRKTRGRAEVYAEVTSRYVTGVVGATGVRPRPYWQGVVALRSGGEAITVGDAALYARQALESAFPTLF